MTNPTVFQFLLAFVQMSRGFKVGFIEVNFPPDVDLLMMALREHPKCEGIQFEVLHLDDPDLRFLLESIKEELTKIEIQPDKKLVLVLQGLEKSIAYSGDNPPILTNLNYARDSFPMVIPHPLLFALPDYAVTRLAQFAPDFWAWTSSTLKFQTLPETRDRLTTEVSIYSHDPNRFFAKPERSDRIDLLERLLHSMFKVFPKEYLFDERIRVSASCKSRMINEEYWFQAPSSKNLNIELQEYPEDIEASSRTRLELLNQLGKAHQSIREFEKAKFYFQHAIELSRELDYKGGEAEALSDLGDACYYVREFEDAKQAFNQSLAIKEEIGDKQGQASTYHKLGMVAQALREYAEARQNYQQALAIFIEFSDRYTQAITYHQLGIVAQELREYAEARQNYQQALAIKIEFGDRYTQARTYHQLGIVAEELREYAEARQNYQQALAIFIEFGDRYTQARTYHQLGRVAEELREYAEARQNYQQALAICIEFGDRYEQAGTYHQLGSVAEELREYAEARQNYQQALAIYIEFGDRYEQASTYGQLGLLAEAEGNLTEAGQNLLQALEIFAQFQDQHSVEISLNNLSRIYRSTQDASLLESISQVLGINVEDARQALESN